MNDSETEVQIAEAQELWKRSGLKGEKYDSSAAWLTVQKRMAEVAEPRVKHGGTGKWLGATLAGIAAFVAAWVLVLRQPSVEQDHKTYSTAPGQRASITLPDGSVAALAPATTLRITGRSVELTGEALFTVSHKNIDPFTVTTGNTVTSVLGTVFSVRKYQDELETRVAVAEGKVSVANARMVKSSAILTNGDIASIGNKVTVDHDANQVLASLSFAQGNLTFNDQSLAEAASQLERWFDIEIRYNEIAGNRRFSTVLQQPGLVPTLEHVARLTHTRYVRTGRIVTFEESHESNKSL